MKKVVVLLVSFVMMIGLCACGSKNNVKFEPKLNKAFTVSAQIKYDDQEYQASIKRLGKANWDVEFSSPNTLAGVLLSYRDDNVEASYKGLSFSVPKSALPLKAIISSLIDVVDTTAELPEISGEEKDGEILVEGELEQDTKVIIARIKDELPFPLSVGFALTQGRKIPPLSQKNVWRGGESVVY